MASMELMWHLIAQYHTVEVANAVAKPFVHSEIRAAGVHQRVAADRRVGISNPNFVRVTRLMEANIETPMNQTTLARRAGLGKRQLERLFARYMDDAPYRYYLGLRLERARHLVRYSDLALYKAALACGFASAASFSRTFRDRFGHAPRRERQGGATRAE
jgi:AraC family carnitine catabolism transcriptional activator